MNGPKHVSNSGQPASYTGDNADMSGQEERKKYRRAAESSSARSPLYRRASRILNSQHLEILPLFPCNVEIPPLALFLDNLRVEIFRNQYMRPLLRIANLHFLELIPFKEPLLFNVSFVTDLRCFPRHPTWVTRTFYIPLAVWVSRYGTCLFVCACPDPLTPYLPFGSF